MRKETEEAAMEHPARERPSVGAPRARGGGVDAPVREIEKGLSPLSPLVPAATTSALRERSLNNQCFNPSRKNIAVARGVLN